MWPRDSKPFIAIACGGTGGHLFPGLAVAEILRDHGCDVALLVSPKQVDQEAAKSAAGMEILTLPAVAMQGGAFAAFARGACQSFRVCRDAFRKRPPHAVLAMGSFTSAPPIWAGRRLKAATFLHEANSIPGRANRWLAPWVDEIFLTFPAAARRLANSRVAETGMPVRPQFQPADPGPCRMALGLAPDKPVLLVTGGSQGARAINELVVGALPVLAARLPDLQILHLTGRIDFEKVKEAYKSRPGRVQVMPFLTEMELALGAATVCVSRAGASSLAEIAAMRVPSILIPYPTAADDHQFYNARELANLGAAEQLDQSDATPGRLAGLIIELVQDAASRERMQAALAGWNKEDAAGQIARRILQRIGAEELMEQPDASTDFPPNSGWPERRPMKPPQGPRLELSARR